jgi:Holliday junction resolvase RusA-like endonuclease
MKSEFFMAMLPPETTHQKKKVTVRNGKPQFYEPDDLKAARAKLSAHLAKHVPEKEYTRAVRVITKWCFPLTGKHHHGEWKATKPDTHNMNKLLFDIMTDLHFWKDDALVTSEIIEKFYSDNPGIYICIEELV